MIWKTIEFDKNSKTPDLAGVLKLILNNILWNTIFNSILEGHSVPVSWFWLNLNVSRRL